MKYKDRAFVQKHTPHVIYKKFPSGALTTRHNI